MGKLGESRVLLVKLVCLVMLLLCLKICIW